jgi:hypothetical protein
VSVFCKMEIDARVGVKSATAHEVGRECTLSCLHVAHRSCLVHLATVLINNPYLVND